MSRDIYSNKVEKDGNLGLKNIGNLIEVFEYAGHAHSVNSTWTLTGDEIPCLRSCLSVLDLAEISDFRKQSNFRGEEKAQCLKVSFVLSTMAK